MKNLLSSPNCNAEDLGRPLPESPHAVSVTMPRWRDVVGYEEGDDRVVKSLTCGYPRFVVHPLVKQLTQLAAPDAAEGTAWLLPSAASAKRCLTFIHQQADCKGTAIAVFDDRTHLVRVPAQGVAAARAWWQHTGEIISSRWAEALLNGRNTTDDGVGARLRSRVAQIAGCDAHDVYLFPTGMAAIFLAHRIVAKNKPSAQFGFPYVDTLKVQQKFGAGCHFYPEGSNQELQQLIARAETDQLSAVFCECPTNPLLRTPPLHRLAAVARRNRIPLVVDNTLDSFVNLDLSAVADLIPVSLTKYFSGAGNVMGGALLINPKSPFYDQLKQKVEAAYEDLNHVEDLLVLEQNAADFENRMARVNVSTQLLCDYLSHHPAVRRVYYPKFEDQDRFESLRKSGTRFHGGVFSFLPVNEGVTAPLLYDALRINKGPSLGCNFTLCCPYTLLAHYHERAWALKQGVSPHLIRVSIGLESGAELIQRFQTALEPCLHAKHGVERLTAMAL